MSWKGIINQTRAIDVLRRGISQGRVGHAYLFHGPDGVGKRAVALAFAQALQCRAGGDTPCDSCDACLKTKRMFHPDIHVLFPYPNDTTVEDISARLKLFGENPYIPFDFVRRPSLSDASKVSNKQAIYNVARVHEELRREMSFKPVEGRYKIAILTDVEAMRHEAANAFLKLLEEPTPATVFVLITTRPDRLLPTILSRCQRLRFDVLQAEGIQQALMERAGSDVEKAAMLARMANGSYSRAMALLENEELLGNRQLVLDYFRFSYARNTEKVAALIDQMGSLGRERLKGLLGLMLSWIRDLMLFRVTGEETLLINIDQVKSIRRFCEHVPDADVAAMTALVEQAIDMIGRNVNIPLALIVLSDALYRAMKGQDADRLYIPLHEGQLSNI